MTLTKLPNDGSKVRYLGGYDEPYCDLVPGQIYELQAKCTNSKGVETSIIKIEELDSAWYVKGTGDGDDNDFDKFELIENCLTNEEMIETIKEKDELIKSLQNSLNKIVSDSNEMLELFVEENSVRSLLEIAEKAIKEINNNLEKSEGGF